MIQTTRNYVYGTEAKKLEYDVYEENTVLKRKKKQRQYKKEKLKAIFAILIIFGLSFIIMYRYAMITEMNYKIEKSSKTYNEIKNENSRLKVQIDKAMDLSQVKSIAEEKLGMQKPDRYQVVYVRVPKSDFTQVSDTYKNLNTSQGSVLSVFIGKIGEFTRLLY